MPDANALRRLIFSQYFFNGLQVACGVIGISLVFDLIFGESVALVVSTGALFTSVADLPSPPKHKFFELLAAWFVSSLTTLVIASFRHAGAAIIIAVLAVTFVAAMLNVYGRKALPVGFSALFAMVIGLGTPVRDWDVLFGNAAWAAGGGLSYLVFAVTVSWLVAARTKEQSIAECLFALANYMRRKAEFYEPGADLAACYAAVAEQQVVVVEKQQAARDLAFRHIVTTREVRLARMLVGAVDVYERIFSSHTDYAQLQAQFGDSDVMLFLRDIVLKAAIDLEGLAFTILWKGKPSPVSYKAELAAITHEIELAGRNTPEPGDRHQALVVLQGVFDRIAQTAALIGALHRVPQGPLRDEERLTDEDLAPFLTPINLAPRLLVDNLRWDAPIFRFAVRVSLAMLSGMLIARLLPYSTHSYWILLTLGVVMRSNYSLTKQRRTDRIIGTIAGCVLTALLLHFHPPIAVELLVLFVALTIIQTFVTINYRVAAAAACVMALLQIHLINPSAPFAIVERLGDTVVGALLAIVWTFVLPRWEHAGIPALIVSLVNTSRRYAHSVLERESDDYRYRLSRKQLFDAIAFLVGAFRRMLNEPRAYQRAVPQLNEFITASYVFAAQITAVRLLLQRRGENVDEEGLQSEVKSTMQRIDANLASGLTRIEHLRSMAGHADLARTAAQPELPLAIAQAPVSSGAEIGLLNPPGAVTRVLIRKRLASIEQSAAEMRTLLQSIALNW